MMAVEGLSALVRGVPAALVGQWVHGEDLVAQQGSCGARASLLFGIPPCGGADPAAGAALVVLALAPTGVASSCVAMHCSRLRLDAPTISQETAGERAAEMRWL